MGTLIKLDDYPVWPVLPLLLKDKTMKRNIIWATASYASLGEYYADSAQITENALRNMGRDSIQPRILKAQEEQQKRTRTHAEVFTPAWICCRMNNHLDEEWFGRKDVFNVQQHRDWTPTEGRIAFPKRRHASWRLYVDSRRLEITCGEAPFIVSRYDAATGEEIPIERRIGLLDRKLRIVGENTDGEQEWVKWAIRAIQSVYGYEYQGDNLLIARINVLMTFVEYMEALWRRKPTEKELKTVANIIAWNFWQMDGLTGTVPKGNLQAPEPEVKPITMEELGWFAGIDGGKVPTQTAEQETTPPCRVCNWRQAHTVTFDSLKTQRGRDVRNMRFDFCIGNPPYQEETDSDSTRMLPIYDKFMDAAFSIGEKVALITPARFLFDAGQTPKAWNKKMLADEHLSVLYYEQDASKVFPNTDIKGGVAITYHDADRATEPIGVYVPWKELKSILQKAGAKTVENSLTDIADSSNVYDLKNIYDDHPGYQKYIADNGRHAQLKTNVLNINPIFTDRPTEPDDYIVYGLVSGKRGQKYCHRRYLKANHKSLARHKVLVPKAAGSGQFGDALPPMIVVGPNMAFTQTFISIGMFDSEEEAQNLHKYLKTKMCRALLHVLKVTQDNLPAVWRYIPKQDFTFASDIDWAQPIPAIDQQLYRKYSLTDDEIAFIESHVKEMT